MTHPTRPWTRLGLIVGTFGLGLALAASSARADYLVASGDVLDVTVFRVPELSHEAKVDVDGKIAFPPLGRLDVAGQTIDAVALTIRDLLSRQEILSNPQVTVALAAARPVFIGGDVATPGAYPYQAGLTIRRALALAGGFGLARVRGGEEVSRLRSERDAMTLDLTRQRVRLARVAAEIAGADTLTAPSADGGGGGARDEIVALEARRLASDLTEAREEKAHLDRAVDLAQDRIATLSAQQTLQASLMERQTGEIERIRDIQSRGLASQARVTEEQRVLDSLRERAAANETEMAAAREGLEGATYALARYDDRRAAALETEKQDALLAIEAGEARLREADRRLAELGASDLGTIRAMVYPGDGTDPVGRVVELDTVLGPGDTLDVTIEMDDANPARTPKPPTTQPPAAPLSSQSATQPIPAGSLSARSEPADSPEARP